MDTTEWFQFLISDSGNHVRATVDQLTASAGLGALAVIGVDLLNCFGTFDCPSSLEVVDECLHEMRPCHRWWLGPIRLPCGGVGAHL